MGIPTHIFDASPCWLAAGTYCPSIGGKASRATRASALHDVKLQTKNDDKARKAGITTARNAAAPFFPVVEKRRMYPDGETLRLEVREMAKKQRPKSSPSGEYLRWDFSSHDGCQSTSETCTKGKHGIRSVNGLRGSTPTQLARRGGRKSSRRIKPGEAGGYLHAVRDGVLKGELSKRKPPTGKEAEAGKKIWKPKRAAGFSPTIPDEQTERDVAAYAFGPEEKLPSTEASQLDVSRAFCFTYGTWVDSTNTVPVDRKHP